MCCIVDNWVISNKAYILWRSKMELTNEQKSYIISMLFVDNVIENDNLNKMTIKGDYDPIAVSETKESIESNLSIIKVLESQL